HADGVLTGCDLLEGGKCGKAVLGWRWAAAGAARAASTRLPPATAPLRPLSPAPCAHEDPRMSLTTRYAETLEDIREAGLFKSERIIASPQAAEVTLADGRRVLNFCANNYLGLADHPAMIEAAKQALDSHGFGMASVRFICGTQDLHKQLERTIADFFGKQDTILYA